MASVGKTVLGVIFFSSLRYVWLASVSKLFACQRELRRVVEISYYRGEEGRGRSMVLLPHAQLTAAGKVKSRRHPSVL